MFKNPFTLFMICIVAVGFIIMVTAMAPGATIHVPGNCYNLLNAAGQVVDVLCH